MSTAGRLQDAMTAALIGEGSYMGEEPRIGPLAEVDRSIAEAAVEAAFDVAWSFIEAEWRKARLGSNRGAL